LPTCLGRKYLDEASYLNKASVNLNNDDKEDNNDKITDLMAWLVIGESKHSDRATVQSDNYDEDDMPALIPW